MNSPYSRLRSIRGEIPFAGLIMIVAIVVVLMVVFEMTFKVVTIEGNQAAVRETWSGGVDPDAKGPKTYFTMRWTETYYPYDMSEQRFVMNDNTADTANGSRAIDTLELKSSDNQRVHFNFTLTWHRSLAHLAQMHKEYRMGVEENLIRPNLMRVAIAHGTVHTAIELYSGPEMEKVRKEVEAELKDPNGPLANGGVVADNLTTDSVNFPDAKYVENIEARQRAVVAQTRFEAEQKANQAQADASRIAALKEQYEKVVAAETAAKQMVIDQQAQSDKATIKNKADAANLVTLQTGESQKIVLAANAARDAEIARAVGIKAVGEANAMANKLLLASYAVPGSDLFTRIKVADALGVAFSGVKGYLPSNMNFNLVSENYDKAVSLLVGGALVPPAPLPANATTNTPTP